jgi:hypothetical protein
MDGGGNRTGLSGQTTWSVGDRRPVYRSALTLRLELLSARDGWPSAHQASQRSSAINPKLLEAPMTKLMMVVVISMSGALYNPSRVLHYIGPDAAAFCWTLKNSLGLR